MFFSRKTAQKIAEKAGDHVLVDLKLDARLKPLPVRKFAWSGDVPHSSEGLASSLVAGKSYAIGSAMANDKIYYRHGDLGLFGAVFEAWKNHWILRTRPEDWWFPVACRIAKAVDKATKGYHAEKVREMFVTHEGKENIAVELPVYTIYEANYDHLFSAFGSELECRIKVPAYAQAMQNDFSTSDSAHTIASQINLMASMQEFFSFEMACIGCGLRGLEMVGSVEDWESLPAKLERVRKILEPIKYETGLCDSWWDHVLEVFTNLAMKRRTPDDPKVPKWWINILCDTTGTKYVGGGGSMPGRPIEVKAYDGWLIPFLTGHEKLLAEDLGLKDGGSNSIRKELSGWNQVPMKVTLTYYSPPVSDESTLIAGMVGFKLHKGEGGKDNREDIPSVEPNHMWAMLLPPNSPVRVSHSTSTRRP